MRKVSFQGNVLISRACICTYKHISKMVRDVYLRSMHWAAFADCEV